MQKFKDIQFINLSASSGSSSGFREIGVNPDFQGVPAYEPKKNASKKYIAFGADNRFPFFLIDLAKKAILHSSILITKVNMLAGDGYQFNPNPDEPEGIFEGEKKRAVELFNKIGLNYKLHKAFSWDITLFGGAYAQFVFGKSEKLAKDLKRIIKPRFEWVRLGNPEDSQFDEEIITHFYHRSWKNIYNPKPEELPVYSKDSNEPNQSHLIGDYSPLMMYYPRPDYLTDDAIKVIQTEAELVNFDLFDLKDGLSARGIITIVRTDYSETEPEKEKEIRDLEDNLIRDKMKGSHNSGSVLVQRIEPGELADNTRGNIYYTPIETSNNEGRHRIINERMQIFTLAAHGLPMPDLAGIPNLSKTGFSSQADMLRSAVQIMYYNRIRPMQQLLIDFYQMILDDNDIKVKAGIQNNLPLVNYISEALWQWAFTRDEFRKSVGYGEMTENQRAEVIAVVNTQTITEQTQ